MRRILEATTCEWYSLLELIAFHSPRKRSRPSSLFCSLESWHQLHTFGPPETDTIIVSGFHGEPSRFDIQSLIYMKLISEDALTVIAAILFRGLKYYPLNGGPIITTLFRDGEHNQPFDWGRMGIYRTSGLLYYVYILSWCYDLSSANPFNSTI